MMWDVNMNRASNIAISPPARIIADQVFSRAAGAPLVPGNSVRILKDAEENYPVWLDAIRSAKKYVHFESYIIHEDKTGKEFAEALAAKAAEGVKVRVVYDWLGAFSTSRKFWRYITDAGAEVRCFNPPRIDSPFGWLGRDHRKMLSVDGHIGYVSGLCVGDDWVGYPKRNIEPWRDTGVEIKGPAVASIDLAFAQSWAACGEPIPDEELIDEESIPHAGDVTLRVIASVPHTGNLYRLDHLLAAGARKSLWITDAYFVGTTSYVQSLIAAAKDGVDVRVLVPSASDIPLVRALSLGGYRPLLEAGIRIFEWNGSMLHAKTAVADGTWARVGSTNLNMASWIGNWELDVFIENNEVAHELEELYLEDLTHSTEIVLSEKKRVRPIDFPERKRKRRLKGSPGSAGRVAAGAVGIGNAISAAIVNRRVLGPSETRVTLISSLLLLGLSMVAILWPRWISIPLAVFGIWFAVSLLIKTYKLHVQGTDANPKEVVESKPSKFIPRRKMKSLKHKENREYIQR
jgi:cardiolipin synthase A/B